MTDGRTGTTPSSQRDVTPDPKPERRPRKQIRVRDPQAMKLATLGERECAACGGPGGNGHHVVQKGSPHFGDDVPENRVTLCGTGTTRCHGAYHGNPYMHEEKAPWSQRIDGKIDSEIVLVERRDAEWVARRIGKTLIGRRRDVIEYVLGKMGDEPGRAWLERAYWIREDESGWTTIT